MKKSGCMREKKIVRYQMDARGIDAVRVRSLEFFFFCFIFVTYFSFYLSPSFLSVHCLTRKDHHLFNTHGKQNSSTICNHTTGPYIEWHRILYIYFIGIASALTKNAITINIRFFICSSCLFISLIIIIALYDCYYYYIALL